MLHCEPLHSAWRRLLPPACRTIRLCEHERYMVAGAVQRREHSLSELGSPGEDESQEAIRPICEAAWRSGL